MIYHQVEHQSLTCKLMLQISKHVSVSKELNFFIYFPLKFTQTSKQREGIFPSQPENVFWHPSRFYWQMKWCWFHVTWRHMKPFVTQSFHAHLHIVGYFFLGEAHNFTLSLWRFRRDARAVLSDWVTGGVLPYEAIWVCAAPEGMFF